jgi:hypothetical protein
MGWGPPAGLVPVAMLAVLGTAQVRDRPPDVARPPSASTPYGDPVPVDLESLALHPERYQRQPVRTRGRFDPLGAGPYYTLSELGTRVLVLLGHGLSAADVFRFYGGPVEVGGVARVIRPKEYVQGIDLDLIEDPDLPPLPAPRLDWPKASITVLSIADMTPFARKPGSRPGLEIGEILADPARFKGKSVELRGRFCGRGLCGDLPPASARSPSDWVLDDGSGALWVSGRAPRGKGFSLDPHYPPDTSRWLEVTGKPEVVGGVVYLRASKVTLTTPPRTAE